VCVFFFNVYLFKFSPQAYRYVRLTDVIQFLCNWVEGHGEQGDLHNTREEKLSTASEILSSHCQHLPADPFNKVNYSQKVKDQCVQQAQFLSFNHHVFLIFCPVAPKPWLLLSYQWTMLTVKIQCFVCSASVCQKLVVAKMLRQQKMYLFIFFRLCPRNLMDTKTLSALCWNSVFLSWTDNQLSLCLAPLSLQLLFTALRISSRQKAAQAVTRPERLALVLAQPVQEQMSA
jgi:hypothetical protein